LIEALALEFVGDFLILGEAIELVSILHDLWLEIFVNSTTKDQFFCCLYRLITLRSYTSQLKSLILIQKNILIELYPNFKNSYLEDYIINNIKNFEGFSGQNPLVRITRFLKHQALNM